MIDDGEMKTKSLNVLFRFFSLDKKSEMFDNGNILLRVNFKSMMTLNAKLSLFPYQFLSSTLTYLLPLHHE